MTTGREPDVLMDSTTGDLPLFTRIVAGQAVVAQRVKARFETHAGDWPLDKDAGIRWTEILGRKPRDLEGLASILALEAIDVPGVIAVEDLEFSDGPTTGAVEISMTIRTLDGETFSVIVEPQGVDGNPSIVVGGVIPHTRPVVP